MKESCGTLLYRGKAPHVEVLIVHPSGTYNRKAPWSIPKGEPDGEETREETARRETTEETGLTPGALTYLGDMSYRKSRKRVHCYAGELSGEEPRIASWEIDAVRWASLEEAYLLLHPDQRVFLDRLQDLLKGA